ncbi:hypothetical protein HMPREF1162_2122 [ [[Propionibacterium] namnetense SK182B-JCVI]|uniref:Uncharacterized protein n=1 Tax=[Propionibacterium] namnetense SK182B-JCVI TaxID=1051006 RepID=F9NXE4_9ACTN|nr:hypothetical protein HMPREF1162_2122 [ [[Propionibacterium] namnetense SK182B-JCVI]
MLAAKYAPVRHDVQHRSTRNSEHCLFYGTPDTSGIRFICF